MSFRLASPSILMLALSLTAGTAAADPLSQSIATLDPLVREVRVAGAWGKPGDGGVYRVLLARSAADTASDRLYVQLIGLDTNQVPAVLWTTEINELAAQKLDVANFSAEVESGGLTVFIDIASPAPDAPASYELLVEDDGTYRFGPASN